MTKLSPLLMDTWNFFRRHIIAICAVMFPFIIPLNLFNVFIETTAPEGSQLHWLAVFINLLMMPIYQGAVILYIASAISGNYATNTEYYRLALRFWLPLIVLYILTFSALAIGFLLFIFPAFIVLARLAFSEFYCILENLSPTDAFAKSWEQTKDYQWLLLGGIIVIIILTALPFWLIQAVATAQGIDSPILNIFLNVASTVLSALITLFGFRVFSLHNEKQGEPN